MKPTIVSLFCGCGGLDIGFKEAGFQTVFATDYWDLACRSFKANNPETEVLSRDIREIDFKSIKEKYGQIDLVIGGPPCPPYSQTRHYLVDKKKGFDDENAGFAVPMYFEALKVIAPKIFVFENVDGFTFKTHSAEFEFLKSTSEALGYSITYKVVNCANYGVPQTRKRFICVGVRKPYAPFVFPRETHNENGNHGLKKWVTCKEVIGDFDTLLPEEESQRPGGKDYELFCGIPPGDNYLFYTEKRGHPKPVFKWKSRYWTFLLKLSPDRPSWTIQASYSDNQGPFHWKNRYLRIEELKRIQTIPDSYIIEGQMKEQWRQIGNAVPSKMAEIIAKSIMEQYYESR